MEVLWNDISATAVFSIQLYESYKHFHVFNQYLHRVGYRPIEDEELVAIRRAKYAAAIRRRDAAPDALHDERALRRVPLHGGRKAIA